MQVRQGIQVRRLWSVTRWVADWPVRSQQAARRNAMVATTALTQRRRELVEVEEFLDLHQRRYDARRAVAMQHTG